MSEIISKIQQVAGLIESLKADSSDDQLLISGASGDVAEALEMAGHEWGYKNSGWAKWKSVSAKLRLAAEKLHNAFEPGCYFVYTVLNRLADEIDPPADSHEVENAAILRGSW